ncbi:hypothetical protein GMSM_20270 [Geomonas sp. Red276]
MSVERLQVFFGTQVAVYEREATRVKQVTVAARLAILRRFGGALYMGTVNHTPDNGLSHGR